MIYTLTLNPAIDYFMSFKESINDIQKTKKFKYIPGGKGINASVILNNLNIKNKAIIQSGGLMGKTLINLMKEKQIDLINIETNADTRVNVKSNFKGNTYELNSSGNLVDKKAINYKLIELINNMQENDILMIMGSLPVGYEVDNLENICKLAYEKKVKLVFDLSQDHLLQLTKYHPELIKPNKKELEDLFKVKINSKDEAFIYAQKLLDLGAKRVLVSFDKTGSIYLDKQFKYQISAIEIDEVNGSGAGDSMITAFIAGLHQKMSLEDTLKLAAGAGTATAASEGIADNGKIKFYQEKIKIYGGKYE